MPKIQGEALTEDHIGRGVIYTGGYGVANEQGFITSFNRSNVFVRYKGCTSEATSPSDLEFEFK